MSGCEMHASEHALELFVELLSISTNVETDACPCVPTYTAITGFTELYHHGLNHFLTKR